MHLHAAKICSSISSLIPYITYQSSGCCVEKISTEEEKNYLHTTTHVCSNYNKTANIAATTPDTPGFGQEWDTNSDLMTCMLSICTSQAHARHHGLAADADPTHFIRHVGNVGKPEERLEVPARQCQALLQSAKYVV